MRVFLDFRLDSPRPPVLGAFLRVNSASTPSSGRLRSVVSPSHNSSQSPNRDDPVDWIEQVMPLIAFMGIAYTQRNGGHIRMDMLVAQLNGRALWLFEWLTSLCVLVLILLLIWGSWAHFSRSFDFSVPWWSRDSSMDIALPLWPAKLVVPLAFSVLALRLMIQLWAFGVAFVTNASIPVAVPLVLDAAAQAASESKYISDNEESQRS